MFRLWVVTARLCDKVKTPSEVKSIDKINQLGCYFRFLYMYMYILSADIPCGLQVLQLKMAPDRSPILDAPL